MHTFYMLISIPQGSSVLDYDRLVVFKLKKQLQSKITYYNVQKNLLKFFYEKVKKKLY